MFNQVNEETGEMVMVLAASEASGWFLQVPSGCYCIQHQWGAFAGFAKPGFTFWLPPWLRIAYIVSQHAMVYNAPVTSAPTRDNVMVEINVAITYQIQSEDDAKKFVYKLGAHQFDMLLYGAASEALRALVRTVDHVDIYSLRGTHAETFNADIKKTLTTFGISILDTIITEARLPPQIKAKRQETAMFNAKIEEQVKRQENKLLEIVQQAEMAMATLERKEEIHIQELVATKNRALLNRREQIVQAEATKEVAIRKAQQDILTGMIAVKAKLASAKAKVATERLNQVEIARYNAQALLVVAEQEATEVILKAKAGLEVTTSKAQGIEAMAEAEEVAAKAMDAKRAFDLELARLKALAQVAKSRPMVISGTHGDALLNDVLHSH
jgi:regulator of protease activity HflC (stomatin/prohibitin superfamily)